MDISERLLIIRDTLCEHSTPRMAEMLGMSRNQLANYLKGKSMSDRMARRIADTFPSVSLPWLMTGQGDMLTDHAASEQAEADRIRYELAQRDAVIASQQRTIESLSNSLIKISNKLKTK